HSPRSSGPLRLRCLLAPDCDVLPLCASCGAAATRALAQAVEPLIVHQPDDRRLVALCQQHTHLLRLLLVADEFSNVLAAGAIAALSHLLIDKSLEGVWKRNVHGGHGG